MLRGTKERNTKHTQKNDESRAEVSEHGPRLYSESAKPSVEGQCERFTFQGRQKIKEQTGLCTQDAESQVQGKHHSGNLNF